MLNEKEMPHYFWAEAVGTVVYIMNITPTTAVYGMMLRKSIHAENQIFHILKYLVALLMFISLMRGELSLIQRQKNASSLDILYNKKGTTIITLPLVGCK